MRVCMSIFGELFEIFMQTTEIYEVIKMGWKTLINDFVNIDI